MKIKSILIGASVLVSAVAVDVDDSVIAVRIGQKLKGVSPAVDGVHHGHFHPPLHNGGGDVVFLGNVPAPKDEDDSVAAGLSSEHPIDVESNADGELKAGNTDAARSNHNNHMSTTEEGARSGPPSIWHGLRHALSGPFGHVPIVSPNDLEGCTMAGSGSDKSTMPNDEGDNVSDAGSATNLRHMAVKGKPIPKSHVPQARRLSLEMCGNGMLDTGEECDDGNTVKGDGCSPTCTIEQFCINPKQERPFYHQTKAKSKGGDLAPVLDDEANTKIKTLRDSAIGLVDIWLGGFDSASEGTWKWSLTGETFVYTNWHPGEPNNSPNDSDCMVMYPDGQWNDRKCASDRAAAYWLPSSAAAAALGLSSCVNLRHMAATASPSKEPSKSPTNEPSAMPSRSPSATPSGKPSVSPTNKPSQSPTNEPSDVPSNSPTLEPSFQPSASPTNEPSEVPTNSPSSEPSFQPSASPTNEPSEVPTKSPSSKPSFQPSGSPSRKPTQEPSAVPSAGPSQSPSSKPTSSPSRIPSALPSQMPSPLPTVDSDGDGLSDTKELMIGTDPNKADTDSDSLDDGVEVNVLGTNPLSADTDSDGLKDKYEDTDGDSLKDIDEVDKHHTNPLVADTDADGLTDTEEVNIGTNPLVADSGFSNEKCYGFAQALNCFSGTFGTGGDGDRAKWGVAGGDVSCSGAIPLDRAPAKKSGDNACPSKLELKTRTDKSLPKDPDNSEAQKRIFIVTDNEKSNEWSDGLLTLKDCIKVGQEYHTCGDLPNSPGVCLSNGATCTSDYYGDTAHGTACADDMCYSDNTCESKIDCPFKSVAGIDDKPRYKITLKVKDTCKAPEGSCYINTASLFYYKWKETDTNKVNDASKCIVLENESPEEKSVSGDLVTELNFYVQWDKEVLATSAYLWCGEPYQLNDAGKLKTGIKDKTVCGGTADEPCALHVQV